MEEGDENNSVLLVRQLSRTESLRVGKSSSTVRPDIMDSKFRSRWFRSPPQNERESCCYRNINYCDFDERGGCVAKERKEIDK